MQKKLPKLFTLEYLSTAELTDEDLHYLFDTKSFTYSVIVEMFKFIGDTKTSTDIINIIRTDDNWVYKYYWNSRQQKEFESILSKVIKNIWRYSDTECKSRAQWFTSIYGLTNSSMKKIKNYNRI